MLNDFYASRSNAFVDGLKLYANCNNRHSSKANSLAYIVIEELNNFKTSKRIESEPLLDDNIKMVAFNFGKQNGQQSFFKLIVNIYNLIGTKRLFVDKIHDMIREHNYKDVSESLIHHRLVSFNWIPNRFAGLPNCTRTAIARRVQPFWLSISADTARQN